MNDYNKEFQQIWQRLTEKGNIKPCTNPQGFVLGGQPAAGKSERLNQIFNCLNGNVLIINADEFRRYHPQFDAIQAKYGDDAPKHTAEFSGKMAEQTLHKALTERYNIAIEGTFRTAQTPLNTLDLMKSHGYKTTVYIQTYPKEISWQGTIKRYNAMIKAGLTPRAVDKAHHDLVCNRLPENADIVYQSGKADEFQVYSRNGLIFDSKTSKELPSKIIQQELDKTPLIFAKETYIALAKTLNGQDKVRLKMYQDTVAQSIEQEKEAHQKQAAWLHFYQYVAKHIKDGKLNLPKPIPTEQAQQMMKQLTQSTTQSSQQTIQTPKKHKR